jgi:hypothetical protein
LLPELAAGIITGEQTMHDTFHSAPDESGPAAPAGL